MILVDIYVPSVDIEYNFQLDETICISTIIEEIAEMIAHKEQSTLSGDPSELILCYPETKEILPATATLWQCQIRTGSRLILV